MDYSILTCILKERVIMNTNQRLSGNECPFRIFGWDSNGNPIPEEQAQLIDLPKSSSVNLTQQQSQISSINMRKTEEKNNAPWTFVIPPEETEEQAQLVDQPKSSSVNLTQQQSQISSINMRKTEEKNNAPWTFVIPPEETEEQAQLVDQPKSLSVSSTQQQSQQPPFPNNYSIKFDNNNQNNQSVLPMPNPNQVGFVSTSYYPNPHSYLIPEDISAICRQDAFNYLEIEKQRESAYIEVLKRRALHDEELRYEQEKKRLNQRPDSTETPKHINGSTSISTNEIPTLIDWKKLVDEFIKKYAIVTVKRRNKKNKAIMILDEDENRHVEIPLKDLTDYYISFIEDTYPDAVEIALKNINRAMLHLKSHIPKLEKSSLRRLEPHQVMFMNGFLDVRELKFYSISESERNQYYTTFSFDMDYTKHFNKPEVFNLLLLDALNDDKDAVVLAYQQIGAIFTPIPTLKKIFLFQGVSNAGKTRIGNIIAKCMPEEDTLVLNNLSELTKDKLDSSPLRLILIKELSKNKLYAKQIATLKALSDGSADTAFTKILMSTNYPIYTDEGGTIEPALKNRLSTLPFPRPMKNCDPDVSCFEDVHFKNEKLGIIITALDFFSFVLKYNRFYKEFEPNISVNTENEQDQFGDKEEFQSNTNHSAESTSVEDIIKKLFDLNNKVSEEMTAECIMNAVNSSSPVDQTRISRSEEVGKVLRKVFDKELKSYRIKGVTCYNLSWKDKISDI